MIFFKSLRFKSHLKIFEVFKKIFDKISNTFSKMKSQSKRYRGDLYLEIKKEASFWTERKNF